MRLFQHNSRVQEPIESVSCFEYFKRELQRPESSDARQIRLSIRERRMCSGQDYSGDATE